MGGVLRRHCLNPVVARLAMFLAKGPLAKRASFIVVAKAITSSESSSLGENCDSGPVRAISEENENLFFELRASYAGKGDKRIRSCTN